VLLHAVVHAADLQVHCGDGLQIATLFGQFPFRCKLEADGVYKFAAHAHRKTRWSSRIDNAVARPARRSAEWRPDWRCQTSHPARFGYAASGCNRQNVCSQIDAVLQSVRTPLAGWLVRVRPYGDEGRRQAVALGLIGKQASAVSPETQGLKDLAPRQGCQKCHLAI